MNDTDAPKRVTDFRIDIAEISEDDFYSLPRKAQELIRAYATFKHSDSGDMRFEIATYRWEEIQAAIDAEQQA